MIKKNCSSQILFHEKKDKIVILIHGFRNTPGNFFKLADLLFKNSFSIYNIRLPGHGITDEKEIFKTKLRDWECCVENIYLDMCDRFKKVYLCGFSLGASLIINLLKKYEANNKIAIISPLLFLKKKFTSLTGILGIFYKKSKPIEIDCSINDDIFSQFTPFVPIPQVYELFKVMMKTRKLIKHIKNKTLCFISKSDHVLKFKETIKIIEKNTDFNLITLEKSYHNILLDVEKNEVNNKILNWFKDE